MRNIHLFNLCPGQQRWRVAIKKMFLTKNSNIIGLKTENENKKADVSSVQSFSRSLQEGGCGGGGNELHKITPLM